MSANDLARPDPLFPYDNREERPTEFYRWSQNVTAMHDDGVWAPESLDLALVPAVTEGSMLGRSIKRGNGSGLGAGESSEE